MRGAALLFALLLAGCAGRQTLEPPSAPARQAIEEERQQARALHEGLARQQRVNRIALPLLTASTDLCPDRVKATLGIRFGNQFSFPEPLRDTALRELGLGRALQVLQVTPGSPAFDAGLQPGDRLIRLDGRDFGVGAGAMTRARPLFEAMDAGRTVALEVVRDAQPLTLEVTPVDACQYPLVIDPSDAVNAYADHRRMEITRGMLRFAADDNELALVVAHELAHNLMGHVPDTLRNAALGSLIDLLAISQGIPSVGIFTAGGWRVESKAFEAEADYVGLYLLARAGYPIDNAAEFWRRVGGARPAQIGSKPGDSHPGTATRALALEAAIREIHAKQAQGLPLTPEPRP